MPRREAEAPLQARVPSDVEQKDRVLFGLTGRQAAVMTVTGLVIYAAWTALATTVHPLIFAVGALPVAAAGFVVAVGRRDGLSLDAWLLAGLRHWRAPRRLVPADGPIPPPPAWVATRVGPGERMGVPAPLRLPATAISGDGLVALGADGVTGLVAASTVAFGLRTAGEQNALVGGFARWLHSLDGPTQILVRAQPVDLAGLAWRLGGQAPSLAHPALEEAAYAHADFLTGLAAGRLLLHRQVLVAVRDRAGGRSAHRAEQTARALSACQISAAVLNGPETTAALAGCLNPAGPDRTRRYRSAAGAPADEFLEV